MTDEKKPEEDEVKDEQLEDVAGGVAPKVVMDSLRGDGLPDGINASAIPEVGSLPVGPPVAPTPVQDPSSSDVNSGGGATKVEPKSVG